MPKTAFDPGRNRGTTQASTPQSLQPLEEPVAITDAFPSPASGLSFPKDLTALPSNTRLANNSPTATNEQPSQHLGRTENARPISTLTRITQVAQAVLTSSNSYASVGNCLLTSSLWTGLMFHPLCALLAVRNEMEESRRKHGASTPEQNYAPGLRQEFLDLFRSPGIYRFALGIVFIFNLMESVALGQVLYSLAFGLAALANLGASSILNSEYFNALDSRRGVVRQREERPGIQLITSPGINWSACDVLFGFFTLPRIPLLSCAGISACAAGGAATAALLSPLWLGDRAAKSPIPLFLNVATNFGFGLAQISSGSPTLGTVCFTWAIASSIMALRQRKASP